MTSNSKTQHDLQRRHCREEYLHGGVEWVKEEKASEAGRGKVFNKGRSLMRERRRGYKIGITLLFEWFVVDKTHCILILNHSFDELSFSKSLCKGGKESTGDVTMGRKW